MENTVHTLQDIFALSTFSVPQYQRAYAWNEDHLTAYLSDLRQQVIAAKENHEKSYFLGTLLLHQIDPQNKPKSIHIVDGQQRLTTSVIFVAAALKAFKETPGLTEGTGIDTGTLSANFILDEGCQKFNTIQEDNPFFRSYILNLDSINITNRSPSSNKLKAAFDFFTTHVASAEWVSLLKILINAKVMSYSVTNAAEATQIFELQNDRGKKLTNLEALKSYLMHLIYIHSKNPDDGLSAIQTHFADIYRDVESHFENNKIPGEDSILSYHTAGAIEWKDAEWRHPKELVKRTVEALDSENIQRWVLDFVGDLKESYRSFTTLFNKLDEYTELVELLMVDRMASFWPLIIKCYKLDKKNQKESFRKALRLMEVFAVRGYGLSNLRSDTGLSSLYRKALEFSGDFQDLFAHLHSMCNWYDLEIRLLEGVDSAGIYKNNRRDALYILWRYENHLRSGKGRQVEHLSWKQYLNPKGYASNLSLEHVAAQSNSISDTDVEWTEGEPRKFAEVATHRLGNLVIDSVSANSSKGKRDFSDKLKSLSNNSTYLSQGELINWAETIDGEIYWTLDSIKKRHEHIKQFVFDTWSPDNYHIPEEKLISEKLIESELLHEC